MLTHAELSELCEHAYDHMTGVTRSLEFCITRHDGVSYVAIRGSEKCIRDWSRNARVLPRVVAGRSGHGGFMRGGKAVAEALMKFHALGEDVVIVGHSLGAAVGVEASRILHKSGFNVREVVLLGCPRVYTLIRPRFKYPVTSYRNGGDIVCNLPPGRFYRRPVPVTQLVPLRLLNWSDHPVHIYTDELKKRVGD